MAWAKRRLTGPDYGERCHRDPNLKQVLKPGDVIEVRVKKIEKEHGLMCNWSRLPSSRED